MLCFELVGVLVHLDNFRLEARNLFHQRVRVHLVLRGVSFHFGGELLDRVLEVGARLLALAQHALVLFEVVLEVNIDC